jgi:hypothetical protein
MAPTRGPSRPLSKGHGNHDVPELIESPVETQQGRHARKGEQQPEGHESQTGRGASSYHSISDNF